MLHLSPQTISGQLSVFEGYLGVQLFDRKGKRLVLNDVGKLILSYAEDIFLLGTELQQSLKMKDRHQKFVFTVGVVDVIPKILAFNILQSSFSLDGPIKLVCREGDFDSLLGELALNKLDLIISDRPVTPGVPIKAYSHLMGESGVSFYATAAQTAQLQGQFPRSLHQQPFLICGDKSAQKISLQSWFEQENILPVIIAEFDDSALMKFFGESGHGVFCTSSTIEAHVVKHYGVEVIGRTKAIKERFYAISPERKVKHPGVKILIDSAKDLLF
ncbi:MAG: LysR family transcriptional activator of nhaA [Gammaproteobacteria bacterium]